MVSLVGSDCLNSFLFHHKHLVGTTPVSQGANLSFLMFDLSQAEPDFH